MTGDNIGSLHELPWPILASDSRRDLANDLMTYCTAVGGVETFNVRWLLYAPPGLIRSEILHSSHTMYWTCFMWISEQTAIISLYSINWLFCITETESVYCAVRNGSLYTILLSAHTVYLCVLCGSQNKQRLFHYTALTDWFLGAFAKLRKCLIASSYLSVCPHGTALLPPARIPRNLIFEYFFENL